MKLHTFGDSSKPAVILVHGVLTPWQIWEEAICYFKADYYVLVPALDSHVEEYPSDFHSIGDEAYQIETYIKESLNGEVHALIGLSMGGAICWEIFRRNNCKIRHLILDGAPLAKMPGWIVRFVTEQYKNIIIKSQKREHGTLKKFSKVFLPERYLETYLKIADAMDETSIQNMIQSVGSESVMNGGSKDTQIHYYYGTEINEVYSAKSARKVKKLYPEAKIKRFRGYSHGELTLYHQKELCDMIQVYF